MVRAFFLHMIQELRLPRAETNLCDLHRLLRGKRVLLVRYTQTHLIALYL